MPKTVSKKITVKKANTGKTKLKMPAAPPDCCFWVNSGVIIRDFKELAEALDRMTDAVFSYHVNGVRNDFAKWVEDVFDGKGLAGELRKSKARKDALAAVKAHLKKYSV